MSDFKQPDLSAPRFRERTKTVLTKALYKQFIEKYPQHEKHGEDLFRKVVNEFNGKLWEATIQYRDGIELPESLGYLMVAKCDRTQRENIDFANSVKYGKKVTHRNWDSDNYIAKICYTNYCLKYRFADRELWGFEAVRQYARSVSHNFAEMYNNYVHLTHSIRLNMLYKNI